MNIERPRIGLFGGSFDPLHSGHILLARWARERLRLDEVWLLPCAKSPDGKRLTPAAERWRALVQALRREAGLRACGVDLECGGVSRVVRTLEELKARWPSARFTWILGQDQAARLGSWKESRRLESLAAWAVVPRTGSRAVPTRVWRRFKVVELRLPKVDVSSSVIRRKQKKGAKRASTL